MERPMRRFMWAMIFSGCALAVGVGLLAGDRGMIQGALVAGAWERATAGDATVVTLAASPLIDNDNG